MTGREKEYAATVVAFQHQLVRDGLAREAHELLQIDDKFLEQVLEDTDTAERLMKEAWHKMKLGV